MTLDAPPDPARGTDVFRARTAQAEQSQAGLRRYLRKQRADFTPFWIVDTIRVTGNAELAAAIAARPDVSAVLPDRSVPAPRPAPGTAVAATGDAEWNIDRIGAPRVWSDLADDGAGIVVANIDTGVQADHPALAASYRGRAADGSVTHDYNWFDPTGLCPGAGPCDTDGHGTHTMGTMVGRADGAGIGVAPGARWIAAKGCESSSCSAAALLAAGQWILAPTDSAGRNPRPDLAPDVVNNSWGGAGFDPWYQQIVAAWVAAGIFPAFSAGNTGPACATGGTPGVYAASYASGALDRNDTAAAFSSRGGGENGETKPDVAAPGVDVRSSVPGGYAVLSGTSMASPHTAGTVAPAVVQGPRPAARRRGHPADPRRHGRGHRRLLVRRRPGGQQRVRRGPAGRVRGGLPGAAPAAAGHPERLGHRAGRAGGRRERRAQGRRRGHPDRRRRPLPADRAAGGLRAAGCPGRGVPGGRRNAGWSSAARPGPMSRWRRGRTPPATPARRSPPPTGQAPSGSR
ncbi:hypothetical protein GCM10020358_14370 [Amorphoplanes nipponensis]